MPPSSEPPAVELAADNGPDSINACGSTLRVSAWACVETILSVILCWGGAYYFNTSWHLIGSVVLAPLFFLGSPPSAAAARRWFVSDWFGFEEHRTWPAWKSSCWSIGTAVGAASPLIFLAIASLQIAGEDPGPKVNGGFLFVILAVFSFILLTAAVSVSALLMTVIGGGGTGAGPFMGSAARMTVLVGTGSLMMLCACLFEYAGRLASFPTALLLGVLVGRPIWAGVKVMLDEESEFDRGLATICGMGIGISVALSVGASAGLLARALLARSLATLRHLPMGIRHLPRNASEAWTSRHVLRPAELVPDLHASRTKDKLALALRGWQEEMWRWRAWRFVAFSLIPLAVFCRVSLKGAAWFWWPLALWLWPSRTGRGGSSRSAEQWQVHAAASHERLWLRFSVLLALVSVTCYFLSRRTGAGSGFLFPFPMPLRVALALDGRDIHLWHWVLWTAAAAGLGLALLRSAGSTLLRSVLRGVRMLAATALLLLTAGGTMVATTHLWENFIHVPPLLFRQAERWYLGEDAVVMKYGAGWRNLATP